MGLIAGAFNKLELIIKYTDENHCYEVTRTGVRFHLVVDGVEYDFGHGDLSADTPDGVHVEFKFDGWSDYSLFLNGVQEYHIHK